MKMSDEVGAQVSTLSKDADLIAVVMRLCAFWVIVLMS